MIALCLTALLSLAAREEPLKLAEEYVEALDDINSKHAKAPGKTAEDELAQRVPEKARKAFDALLRVKEHADLLAALRTVADGAVDLDLENDFAAVRERAVQLDPDAARTIGVLISRPRFSIRGVGGLDARYCEHFADVFEAVLEAYDDVFGFDEFSKVPGKKLRVFVHLETSIERPPHFAPQFPYHSQIDFPVADAQAFESPTADGKFLFYGLCHELGHVISMWGNSDEETDHHAWAHYTGVVIVEHLSKDPRRAKVLEGLRDVRWRSLEKEREAAQGVKPGLDSYAAVMALLIELHDTVGPRSIGDALDLIDASKTRLRINRVRYTNFEELRKALLTVVKSGAHRKRVEELLP